MQADIGFLTNDSIDQVLSIIIIRNRNSCIVVLNISPLLTLKYQKAEKMCQTNLICAQTFQIITVKQLTKYEVFFLEVSLKSVTELETTYSRPITSVLLSW